MARILIIDDDAAILNLMTKACRQQGHEVDAVLTSNEALQSLDASPPDLMIVDLILGEKSGMDIIRYAHEKHPDVQLIMVTGQGSVEIAVEAMRLGAFDYLAKPFEVTDLQKAVALAIQQRGAETPAERTLIPDSSDITLSPKSLIGESPKMKEIFSVIDKIANISVPILLEGEFGCGKQMVARSIHNASERKDAPFKVLQCSALPEDLLESELFGSSGSRGGTIFDRAMGGTVLLEEIHVLPLRLQSKLDRFLEETSAHRSNGSLPPAKDVRLVISSATPLETMVADGKFREDLYYKISVIPIPVPQLRSRKEDIILLAEYFLKQFAEQTGRPVPEIDKYSQRLLEHYNWPGNVGELQNAIERACAFSEKNRIRPVDLPPKVAQKVEITDDDERTTHHLPIGSKLAGYIKKQEKLFIRETLKYNSGSRERAASMLGISIATLYRKMGMKLEREKLLNG